MTTTATIHKCPNGHTATEVYGGHGFECIPCRLIATGAKTGGAPCGWQNIDEHAQACRNLQDDIDAAFDNQYFDSEGW